MMTLSHEELLQLKDLPHDTLKTLNVYEDVIKAIQRDEESSQRRRLELEAQLREVDDELKKLKLQRKTAQRELKNLGEDVPKEPPGASSSPEVRKIVKYFCDFLGSSGFSLKYRATRCTATRTPAAW
jgi:hypothetical protein